MVDHYRRTLDIQNRGFGGYNTTFARELFDSIFAKKEQANHVPQIRLVTIWFGTLFTFQSLIVGTNDACLPHNPMGQHCSLTQFRENLTFFLESLTSESSPYAAAQSPLSIVLVTPPAMCVEMLPPVLAEARDPEVTKQYVDVVLDLAKEWKGKGEKEGGKWRVEGIDMWASILKDVAGDEEKMKGHFTCVNCLRDMREGSDNQRWSPSEHSRLCGILERIY